MQRFDSTAVKLTVAAEGVTLSIGANVLQRVVVLMSTPVVGVTAGGWLVQAGVVTRLEAGLAPQCQAVPLWPLGHECRCLGQESGCPPETQTDAPDAAQAPHPQPLVSVRHPASGSPA